MRLLGAGASSSETEYAARSVLLCGSARKESRVGLQDAGCSIHLYTDAHIYIFTHLCILCVSYACGIYYMLHNVLYYVLYFIRTIPVYLRLSIYLVLYIFLYQYIYLATIATLVSARSGRWNGDGSQASAAAIGWVGSGCPTSCPPAPTCTAGTRVTRAVQGVRPNPPEGLTRAGDHHDAHECEAGDHSTALHSERDDLARAQVQGAAPMKESTMLCCWE